MSRATVELPAAARAFLTSPHTAAFTTLRPDGTPHVTPVRFTFDADTGLVRGDHPGGSPQGPERGGGRPGGPYRALSGGRLPLGHPRRPGRCSPTIPRVWPRRSAATDRYGGAPPAPLDLVVIEITVNRFLSLNLNRWSLGDVEH
ncbi:hypothetical protein SVIOM74S_10276 [Streptomyces violarus]